MSRFTVTVESDRPDGGLMTIHLDTSAGTSRVLEVTVTAGQGGSVSGLSLPHVSLDQLLSAFAGPDPAAPPVGAAPGGTAPPVALPEQRSAPDPGPGTEASGQPAPETAERNYRRMPDADELVAAYRNAASIGALAAAYGVPRHTMNGWLSRLRRQGLIASRRDRA
ncbi:hypothetical protein [Jidongwangia harbinensis]|uniref:hypothetical protein n=1 Tax=Jidongwangia harbinensis TaxID=2878561 RepID=UPI001CDA0E0F|nr:hypothetical protein [Jidongwangia harbinensis]MCA2215083.1 hypothetical protein [Jidongwangia harbinensis]